MHEYIPEQRIWPCSLWAGVCQTAATLLWCAFLLRCRQLCAASRRLWEKDTNLLTLQRPNNFQFARYFVSTNHIKRTQINTLCHIHSVVKLTSSQEQDSISVPVQRRLFVHDYLDVVDAPLEHERAHTHRVHLAGHQRVPPGEGEDVVGEVSGRVDALWPVDICYTLRRDQRN